MKEQFANILILAVIIVNFSACDSVKRVSDTEYLLTNTTVMVNDKKDNTEVVNNLLYQKANRKIIGTPLRLHVYNLARPNRDSIFESWLDKTPKRRSHLEKTYSKKQLNKLKQSAIGFNNWLKKSGEAPVILSEYKSKRSVKRLKDYYINHGWFDVTASYNIEKIEKKRAETFYEVKTGAAFLIDSITENIKTPIIDSLYQNIRKSTLVKKGNQYRTLDFEAERERISAALRNSGIYHFNQDYISFVMDTIGTNKKVNVSLQIQDRAIRTADSVRREPFKRYTISDVNIITDYRFENRNKPFTDSINYGGFKLYGYDKIRYRPKAITDAVFISPGGLFKDIDRTRTYRYINELRTFKYPNIEYIENPDNTLSDTIRLSPLKKFSFGFSTDVSQSNIQTIGFSLNPSLQIRNFFKGAETLEISGVASVGSSKSPTENDGPFFDINEFGADLKLTIPRLFSPFYTENIIPKYMSPSTRISLAATSQTNIGLDKQTLSGNFSYTWFPNRKITNRLDLFNVQYVRNLRTDNYFTIYNNSFQGLNNIAQKINYIPRNATLNLSNTAGQINEANMFIADVLSNNTSLRPRDPGFVIVSSIEERKQRLTENNLIISSSFGYTKDRRTNLFDNDFSIFRFKLELAGNLLASTAEIFGLTKDSDNRFQLFNVAFSQYIKTEFDYIKHWSLSKKNIIATRSFLGIAVPYGNSNSIPFAESFFGGGPNDNRAWTAYNLGPGSSETTNEFNEANLKIALSAEERFNLFGDLNGALFIDVGNIWNVLDNVEDDKATFKGLDALEDIAVGSGFGLRYDFSFFVFRFDIGFKTYDPSNSDNNRWFRDYNFGNAVYNIGINYPF